MRISPSIDIKVLQCRGEGAGRESVLFLPLICPLSLYDPISLRHRRGLACLTAERPAARTQSSRAEPAEHSAPRRSWEPTAQLDGSPVDRYSVSATKPIRAQHRLAKAGRDKDARVPLPEDVGKVERVSDSKRERGYKRESEEMYYMGIHPYLISVSLCVCVCECLWCVCL